jgi:hypothetical protein
VKRGKVMKEYVQSLIVGFVFLIIALILIAIALSINIPSAYRTFFGIPYQVNPEYITAFGQFFILFIFGLLFGGVSIGILVSSYPLYMLEKKLDLVTASDSKLVAVEKKYCQYCGTENSKDALYCVKCGKSIASQ